MVFSGRRYDTGDRGDYLRAVVRIAADRSDLGPDFVEWLREFLLDHQPTGPQPTGHQPTGHRPTGPQPADERPVELRPAALTV